MRRRRLLARIRRASPYLIVSILAVLVVGFGTVTRRTLKSLPDTTKVVTRSDGVLALPAPVTRKLIARGDSLFHKATKSGSCASCHGADGQGTQRGPRLAFSRSFIGDGSMESIARIIRGGVRWPPGLGPPMPAYEGVLSREDIWAISAYVRTIAARDSD